ncbi:glycogenin-2 isoform X3 [Heptranchias perlo]|uniref:glycogenin-2 isoform X3 n=1 Tax=Heptranchias perlo TaxID=212740 RepID=UPI0035598904
MSVVTDQAFVTLATNDVYCQGALVLCQSLRHHQTSRRLVVLTTPQVPSNMRCVLERLFDEVIEVNVLDSSDSAHLALLTRPELGVTFTKIHCWRLIQYSKCVFMDADTLVCSNIDDLFEREELSAAPDPGWPDCFNTGVFVYTPSIETYNQLLQFAAEKGSFDGGDQGLLNSFFSGWSTKDIHKHLPFIYNLSGIAIYSYLPAFKQFGSTVKVVHFLGPTKPWHHKYNPQTRSVIQENMSPSDSMFIDFLNSWWGIYSTSILPLLVQCEDEEKKSVSHQMHQGGDLQVSMSRQEEPATREKHPVATKSMEPQAPPQSTEPVIGRQPGDFYVQQPETIAAPIPKIIIQQPELGLLVQPLTKRSSPRHLTMLRAEPRKSSMKMRKEKIPSVASEPHEQLVFAYKPTANIRHQSAPMAAEPRKSSMKRKEKIHFASESHEQRKETVSPDASVSTKPDKEKVPPVAPESTKQEDVAASLPEVVPKQPMQEEERHRWEEGNIDYLGKDAFVNIQKKLDRFLK